MCSALAPAIVAPKGKDLRRWKEKKAMITLGRGIMRWAGLFLLTAMAVVATFLAASSPAWAHLRSGQHRQLGCGLLASGDNRRQQHAGRGYHHLRPRRREHEPDRRYQAQERAARPEQRSDRGSRRPDADGAAILRWHGRLPLRISHLHRWGGGDRLNRRPEDKRKREVLHQRRHRWRRHPQPRLRHA